MKKNDYSEKLKSPKWQKKRLQIMNRDKFTCKKCGDKETSLHVHHKSYINGKDPWDYENNLLITLCEDCHSAIEEIKKEDPDVLFEWIHIYKSNKWTSGGKIMYISIPEKCTMTIYDEKGNWSDGYVFNYDEIIRIMKILKKAL